MAGGMPAPPELGDDGGGVGSDGMGEGIDRLGGGGIEPGMGTLELGGMPDVGCIGGGEMQPVIPNATKAPRSN